jgi:hypothetical protein
MGALRVCYLWEMGLMVKSAQLERSRERRIQLLGSSDNDKTPELPCWASTTNETCPDRRACDDRGCQLYADDFQDEISGKA